MTSVALLILAALWLPIQADEAAAVEQAQREALSRIRRSRGEASPEVANAVIALASTLDSRGQSKNVEKLYRLEIDVSRKNADKGNTRALSTAFAEWLLKAGRPADAELLARGALKLGLETLKADDWRLAGARAVAGEALAARGRFAQAEPFLLKAQAGLETAADAPEEAKKKAVRDLVALYEAWERASPGQGKMAEAARWKARF